MYNGNNAFEVRLMPIHADNDNVPSAEGPRFTASRTALYVPAALLACAFAALILWLETRGPGGSPPVLFALALLMLGLPAVLVQAFLRSVTICVQPMTHGLLIQRGFPRHRGVTVPWQNVRELSARSGVLGTLLRSGTLTCHLHDGQKFVVRDLDQVQTARRQIAEIFERHASSIPGAAKTGRLNAPAATG